jgi:hypothetical protein
MEMSREPSLDATVFPHQLDKLLALLLVGMVEPTASVDHVIFLQDAQSRSVGGCTMGVIAVKRTWAVEENKL